ncbi:MAG TPA: hypothetical protein VM008_06190 [Phycisphaerae bacterium]|nr:hypothetical protein [Phycisphaerae bacterium]
MSLSRELEELERQRSFEVRNLHYTYLCTKREVKRMANPTRFVRKHFVFSLVAGAALGLLLAPRPSPRPMSDEVVERAVRKAHRGRGLTARWLRRLVARFSPEAAQFIPHGADAAQAEQEVHEEAEQIQQEAKEEGKRQKKSGTVVTLQRILEAALPLILGKFDWRVIMTELMRGVHEKSKERSENGHTPQVSVADAGAVKAADLEDFE